MKKNILLDFFDNLDAKDLSIIEYYQNVIEFVYYTGGMNKKVKFNKEKLKQILNPPPDNIRDEVFSKVLTFAKSLSNDPEE